ncbi:hypothetical protein L9F63_026626 [Diploptera punctata]|uniref:peptidylprolyl isomerase n=1 Tax=Diploptera punctata TaxID=6984 RepID=A0AAD8AGP3_DIPPU|nr:hypothetical protein L9F63_026626 [Diploptera punctata]
MCDEEKATNVKKKLQIGVKKRVDNCQLKSKKGDFLHMHYVGTLEDGAEFDNSYSRGQPLTFTLGSGQVIRGWDQDSWGAPPKIPGDATLIFEVELVKIDRKDEF